MRYKKGDKISDVKLPAISGITVNTADFRGQRYMLSFFRFAGCPFCNLRMHELTKRFKELGDDFTIVAVFDSPLDNLQKYSSQHQAPFHVLADEKNNYYRQYDIRQSFIGLLRGAVTRLPVVLYAVVVKRYLPLAIKGKLATMPADFLVDEQGIIQRAHYGHDPGDHVDFEQVKAFALEGKKSL
jgi:thioredoxin-dependent peroxiredoxin